MAGRLRITRETFGRCVVTFLSGIAGLAFVFATTVLFWWHSSLDVRVCLAGIYILTGTVSTFGATVYGS
jgi:hypothetical protein